MKNNLNLCEILRGHEEEEFYSPLTGGNVKLDKVTANDIYIDELNLNCCLNSDGSFYKGGECMLFPSKDQHDWNKWIEEQKPKVPKTWSDIEKQDNRMCSIYHGVGYAVDYKFTPIEKSAFALLKIYQLIEAGYGGNITNKEWNNLDNHKYRPVCSIKDNCFIVDVCKWNIHPIAFHTKEQAEEFLSYPENIQLLKDYFMI